MKKLIALLFAGVFCVFLASPAMALEVPEPDLVVDQADALIPQLEQELRTKIEQTGSELGGAQFGILIINSLEGEAIEDYSIKVAREWGIGDADKDNGVLILVAMQDRQMRIEVGRGLEGSLTDAEAGRIIDGRMKPEFREGHYFEGLMSALDGIKLAIGDEFDPVADKALKPNPWGVIGGLVSNVWWIIFLVPWVVSIFARSKSWWAGGIVGGILGVIGGLLLGLTALFILTFLLGGLGFLFDYLVSKNYKTSKRSGSSPSWWAGGGGWGGSSGGSSGGGGFGGGSFGGGGSSGSW